MRKGKLIIVTDYKENSIKLSFEINCLEDSNEADGVLEIKIEFKKKFSLYIQQLSDSISKKILLRNKDYEYQIVYYNIIMILCILSLVNKNKMMNFIKLLEEIAEVETSSKIIDFKKYLNMDAYSNSNYLNN